MKIKKEIDSKGFYFSNFPKDKDIYTTILNTLEPNDKIENFFTKVIEDHGFCFDKLHLVYEDITLGLYHETHTHLTPSDYQAVVWVPKDSYEGRAFLYGSKQDLKKHYPEFGDICFMKTNDLNFIHGVEPLETDTLVRTLLISINYRGKHGEHVTVSSENLKSI